MSESAQCILCGHVVKGGGCDEGTQTMCTAMFTPHEDGRPMTSHQLKALLESHFPANAFDWSEATDEVRDLSRMARIQARVPESQAINFRALEKKDPADWNRIGVKSIVDWYHQMTVYQKHEFLAEALLHFPEMFKNMVVL